MLPVELICFWPVSDIVAIALPSLNGPIPFPFGLPKSLDVALNPEHKFDSYLPLALLPQIS